MATNDRQDGHFNGHGNRRTVGVQTALPTAIRMAPARHFKGRANGGRCAVSTADEIQRQGHFNGLFCGVQMACNRLLYSSVIIIII
jgi:hypothetical protein